MPSTTSWILFGVIALVAVIIWKWWKKPVSEPKKNDDILPSDIQMISEESTGPPPMVFAVNDHGNLDLEDMSGKILNRLRVKRVLLSEIKLVIQNSMK